jgi:hypothetical protein
MLSGTLSVPQLESKVRKTLDSICIRKCYCLIAGTHSRTRGYDTRGPQAGAIGVFSTRSATHSRNGAQIEKEPEALDANRRTEALLLPLVQELK